MRPLQLQDDQVLLAVPLDDVDHITELCQDEQVQRWTTVPVPYLAAATPTGSSARSSRPGQDSGQELSWAVRDPADHRVLGMIGLRLEGDGSTSRWDSGSAPRHAGGAS